MTRAGPPVTTGPLFDRFAPADPAATQTDWRLQIFDSLGSTSDHCIARASEGEAEGLAALALRQTSGRGTRGRPWQAPPGNLNLSFLVRPDGDAMEAGRWSLLVAVALAEALSPYLPDPSRLRLKWPNDLLLRGAKLSGILIESALQPDGRLAWLVIGCGVNLVAAPSLPDRPTACLAQEGLAPPPPDQLAQGLLRRIDHWRRIRARDGFDAIRHAWLTRSAPSGTPVTLTQGASTIHGTFAGVSDTGHLLLQTNTTLRSFASGETSWG
jgi:BirA family biotin operon repressor/biotin-[acetyl-CoA-carboxylase] ligase